MVHNRIVCRHDVGLVLGYRAARILFQSRANLLPHLYIDWSLVKQQHLALGSKLHPMDRRMARATQMMDNLSAAAYTAAAALGLGRKMARPLKLRAAGLTRWEEWAN